MRTVRSLLEALEAVAPRRFALSFDRVGLQVGDLDAKVERAVVALDRSLGSVDFTRTTGAQFLLTHHPLLMRPLESVDSKTHTGRTVLALVRAGIAFAAAHTNWDAARGGINDVLAHCLGLQAVRPFGEAAETTSVKLVVFCPPDAADQILDAVAEMGAGVIGVYRRCGFKGAGTGTYIARESSHPTIGTPGVVEETPEVRLETVVRTDLIGPVVRAMRKAHPYEEPAFDLTQLAPRPEQPIGRIGELSSPLTLAEFNTSVGERLSSPTLAWGDPMERIRRVAVVGGAGDSDWMDAQRVGADVLVTGEVKQHVAVEASESGMALIAAGHYATEQPGCQALRDHMADAAPEVEWILFTPPAGRHGRPFSGQAISSVQG